MKSDRRLKIGIVIDQLLPGGVQLAALEQIKQLNLAGHQAKLLILMRKKYSYDFSHLVKNLPHQYLSDSYPWPFRKTFKFPIFSFLSTLHLLSPVFVSRVIREKQYDILLSHGTTTCLSSQVLWKKRKIPSIAFIHDPMVYILEKCYRQTLLRYFFPIIKPLAKMVEKSFVQDAIKTIIVSKIHRSYISKNYKVEPTILFHGCHTLKKLPSKRGPAVLSLGRWQKEKNPLFLLKLAKLFPNTPFIVAGSWSVEKDLRDFQKEIKRQNLNRQVSLITYFEDSQLPGICAQARVWLHPHPEAFGLAGLQAAGMGLPLIIPKKSGLAEIFTDSKEGFFPEKVSVKEYRQKLAKLLKNERLAYQMGKKAWQKVKRDFSWKIHTEKLIRVIESSLAGINQPEITALEISHASGTGLAGGDKLLEEMLKRMDKKPAVHIITSLFGEKHWRQSDLPVKLEILKTNTFDSGSGPIPVFLSYIIRMWQTSLFLIHQNTKTTILNSSTNILPDILPAFIAKVKNPEIKWIGRIHHLVPPPTQREGLLLVNTVSYLMQEIALFCLKRSADSIVVLNRGIKQALEKKGVPGKKIMIMGAGINFRLISGFKSRHKKSFDGIYLGRLHIAKGIFDAVEIWEKVVENHKSAKLGIIGAGPASLRLKIQKLITTKKLEKNIKILGYLPQQKVFGLMKSAKIFIFTDHEAGWGMAIAEAMACGLPVVGYNIGIFGDVYQHGYLTAPLANKKKFAGLILKLLEDESLRKKLSILAKKEASNFDWIHTSQKFNRLINNL